MQDLKVIGVENGALLAASDDGERYRIAIDEVLQSKLRENRVHQAASSPKISPREVQAHIRTGLSAEDVATLTGASLEYVQRFEGPIVAEREHIVAQALSVPVRTGVEVDPLGEANTFGIVIRDRLAALGASGERWASWKETEGGWFVKLSFTADGIDHDARWGYDPRKNALSPSNAEATTLSQQGELQQGAPLIPRLRAVVPLIPNEERFDSGAFDYLEEPAAAAEAQPAEPAPLRPSATTAAFAAMNRADEDAPDDAQQTADLLDALRRRRGEREAALFDEDDFGPAEETVAVRPREERAQAHDDGLAELAFPTNASAGDASGEAERRTPFSALPAPLPSIGGEAAQSPAQSGTGAIGARSGGSSRRGRASMPSWDEIVFGARGDDDLA